MSEVQFDLREWTFLSNCRQQGGSVPVLGLRWDLEKMFCQVCESVATLFSRVIINLPHLLNMMIARWTRCGNSNIDHVNVGTFAAASNEAYVTVFFSRMVQCEKVYINLLAVKSRVAPLRKLSIPRLERMVAKIGSRLYTHVMKSLKFICDTFFWSDSPQFNG